MQCIEDWIQGNRTVHCRRETMLYQTQIIYLLVVFIRTCSNEWYYKSTLMISSHTCQWTIDKWSHDFCKWLYPIYASLDLPLKGYGNMKRILSRSCGSLTNFFMRKIKDLSEMLCLLFHSNESRICKTQIPCIFTLRKGALKNCIFTLPTVTVLSKRNLYPVDKSSLSCVY